MTCVLNVIVYLTAPNTLKLGTKTETWCEPLTYCYRETRNGAETLEWAV